MEGTADNKKKLFLAIFMVIAVLVWIRGLKPPTRRVAHEEEEEDLEEEFEEVLFEASQESTTAGRLKSSFINWGRNPFTLGVSSKLGLVGTGELTSLILNGIVWDKVSPFAIINGIVLKVGDRIGETEVIEIKQESVLLRKATGGELLLKIE